MDKQSLRVQLEKLSDEELLDIVAEPKNHTDAALAVCEELLSGRGLMSVAKEEETQEQLEKQLDAECERGIQKVAGRYDRGEFQSSQEPYVREELFARGIFPDRYHEEAVTTISLLEQSSVVFPLGKVPSLHVGFDAQWGVTAVHRTLDVDGKADSAFEILRRIGAVQGGRSVFLVAGKEVDRATFLERLACLEDGKVYGGRYFLSLLLGFSIALAVVSVWTGGRFPVNIGELIVVGLVLGTLSHLFAWTARKTYVLVRRLKNRGLSMSSGQDYSNISEDKIRSLWKHIQQGKSLKHASFEVFGEATPSLHRIVEGVRRYLKAEKDR